VVTRAPLKPASSLPPLMQARRWCCRSACPRSCRPVGPRPKPRHRPTQALTNGCQGHSPQRPFAKRVLLPTTPHPARDARPRSRRHWPGHLPRDRILSPRDKARPAMPRRQGAPSQQQPCPLRQCGPVAAPVHSLSHVQRLCHHALHPRRFAKAASSLGSPSWPSPSCKRGKLSLIEHNLVGIRPQFGRDRQKESSP
jgi:hypothetical protein